MQIQKSSNLLCLEATNIVIHSLLPSKIQYRNIMNINTNIVILSRQFAATKSTIYKFQIDVEGSEFSQGGFQEWISSGALTFVNQIALELHIPDSPADER